MLNFKTTDKEAKQIASITKRVAANAWDFNLLDLQMDLAVCNNGCPIDFERLLAANEADFAHDIFGIHNHLNRESGELGNCFVPRCSR